jgi:hypothetical protein
MEHSVLSRFPTQKVTLLDAHEAASTLASATVMGYADTLVERRIQQDFAGKGGEDRVICGNCQFPSHSVFLSFEGYGAANTAGEPQSISLSEGRIVLRSDVAQPIEISSGPVRLGAKHRGEIGNRRGDRKAI